MPLLLEADGGKHKPLNYNQNFTHEQLGELIRCTDDPIYFINTYVKIVHPLLGAIPFKLYDYQVNLINCYNTNRRSIALMSRQSGKSVTAAAYLLWWLIFHKQQRVLVCSKDQDGADEIMEHLWYAYEELPWWLKPGVKSDQIRTKVFENGSRIKTLGTTKTSGRGKANSLIYLDEFAFVEPGIIKHFWISIYPTISTGGKCIITSTPNTDEDKFANIWLNCEMDPNSDPWVDVEAQREKLIFKDDENDIYTTIYEDGEIKGNFERNLLATEESEEDERGFVGFHTKWTSVPDPISKSGFRDESYKRRTLMGGVSEDEWRREFDCSFVTGDTTLISPIKLAVLRQYVRKPRFIDRWGCRWYEEIKPNVMYAVALDPSGGIEQNDACIQVWELPSLIQVAEWNDAGADQPEQARMLKRVLKRIYIMQQNDPEHAGGVDIYYSVERNGLGIGVLNLIDMNQEAFPGYLIDATATTINVRGSKGGFDPVNYYRGLITSVSTKKRFCEEFKSLVERNLFIPRSQWLISQMKTFVKKGNSWAAKEGAKDDIIMSAVLMCQLIEEIRFHEPDLDDYIGIDVAEHDPDDMDDPWNHAMPPIV